MKMASFTANNERYLYKYMRVRARARARWLYI